MMTPGWEGYAAFVVPALFIISVGLLFWMRDPLPINARRVSHAVWCPQHRRVLEVVFREASGGNGLTRIVESCPLRRRRDRCGDACALPPSPQAWRRHLARRLRTHRGG